MIETTTRPTGLPFPESCIGHPSKGALTPRTSVERDGLEPVAAPLDGACTAGGSVTEKEL